MENPTALCTPENTPFPFLLLGNKCDMPERRVVSAQEGLSFARTGELGVRLPLANQLKCPRTAGGAFFECSALSRANIDASFTSLIRSIARSNAAKEIYRRNHPNDRDCDNFSGNIGMLDKAEASAAAAATQSSSSGRKVGLAEEEELTLAEARERQRKERGRKGVALDKKNSRSIGGMGMSSEAYLKEQERKQKGCGCIVS